MRRAIELAWSQRGWVLHLLALDWAKAFDSISTKALQVALHRFSRPQRFVVAAVYEGCIFCGREGGVILRSISKAQEYVKDALCRLKGGILSPKLTRSPGRLC